MKYPIAIEINFFLVEGNKIIINSFKKIIQVLGISLPTLYSKIETYKLSPFEENK